MTLLSTLFDRRIIVVIGLAGLLLGLSIASQPANADRSLPEHASTGDRTFIASLDPVEGMVQYQTLEDDPAATLAWSTSTDVTLVSEGDRIRTDSNGYAYLTFFEGLETEIGPDTLVVVSTLDIPPAGQEGNFDVTLDVLVGNTLTNVDTLLDTQDRIEVHTPGATAVVRGTKWYTLVVPNGNTIFSALESTLFVFQNSEADPNGPPPQLPDLIPLPPGFSLFVSNLGVAGEPYEGMDAAFGPQGGPLAPATCGDLVCDPGEEDICALDCTAPEDLPTCGDLVCDREAGEGLVTCPTDCGPYEGAECGNGVCDRDESGLSCPSDCAPNDYFSPVNDAWCGNGTCDITESALTCLDCRAQEEDLGLLCVLSAAGEPVHTGPGDTYPVSFILGAGTSLTAVGVNAEGTWYAVDQDGQQLWVKASAVNAEGACAGLPSVQIAAPPPPSPQPPTAPLPPPPAEPTLTPTPAGPGTWLGCGSCDTCGYPAGECVTSPDGQCLWDPATCRQPATTQAGTLTVPSSSYECYYGQAPFTVVATYNPLDSATISSYGASSNNSLVYAYAGSQLSPLQFEIYVDCGGQLGGLMLVAQTSNTAVVTAQVTDSEGRQASTSFTVTVYPG